MTHAGAHGHPMHSLAMCGQPLLAGVRHDDDGDGNVHGGGVGDAVDGVAF